MKFLKMWIELIKKRPLSILPKKYPILAQIRINVAPCPIFNNVKI
jgi:hypothetical protein